VSPSRTAALARALRELREEAKLTQNQLATALSEVSPVSGPTISSWESENNPKIPNRARIATIARFFATSRSLTPTPHLLALPELTESEEDKRAEIEARLLGLLDDPPAAARTAPSTLVFDSGPLTVICAELPPEQRTPLADPTSPNFTKLHQYADVDPLLELWGHLRAYNPTLDVKHRISRDIRTDDMSTHVILLGGIAWNRVTRQFQDALRQLPITQVKGHPDVPDGDVFMVGDTPYLPEWHDDEEEGESKLKSDVALLARLPNPFNSSRSLTICNGIHSRGVYGAVRCLTDLQVRDANERYLAETYPDGQFAMLLRVPVIANSVMSPDLLNDSARLYEWKPERSRTP
jgi:transcriptional regulator with XRE-family HTH domain